MITLTHIIEQLGDSIRRNSEKRDNFIASLNENFYHAMDWSDDTFTASVKLSASRHYLAAILDLQKKGKTDEEIVDLIKAELERDFMHAASNMGHSSSGSRNQMRLAKLEVTRSAFEWIRGRGIRLF